MLVGGVIRPPSFFPFKSFLNGYTQDDTVFLLPYSLGNLWINAIICYHILNLLKCSKNAQRVKPPSLLAANLQGGAVCLAAVTYGLILYFVTNAKINQIEKTSNRYGDYLDKVNTQMVATWSSFAILGFTPLIYAVMGRHAKTCQILAKKGAKVNSFDKTVAPILIATQNGDLPMCKILVKHKADLNVVSFIAIL